VDRDAARGEKLRGVAGPVNAPPCAGSYERRDRARVAALGKRRVDYADYGVARIGDNYEPGAVDCEPGRLGEPGRASAAVGKAPVDPDFCRHGPRRQHLSD